MLNWKVQISNRDGNSQLRIPETRIIPRTRPVPQTITRTWIIQNISSFTNSGRELSVWRIIIIPTDHHLNISRIEYREKFAAKKIGTSTTFGKKATQRLSTLLLDTHYRHMVLSGLCSWFGCSVHLTSPNILHLRRPNCARYHHPHR